MRAQGEGGEEADHRALLPANAAAATLSGASPARTTKSGRCPKTMPKKASAAKASSAGRRRRVENSLMPVAMTRPAAAAETPPRRLPRTPIPAWRR